MLKFSIRSVAIIGSLLPSLLLVKAPIVILKLDDLRGNRGEAFLHPGWKRVTDYLVENNIKGSIGVIGIGLEGDKQPFFEWCKETQSRGLIELWHHGYLHKRIPYQGKEIGVFATSYELQLEYYNKTQEVAREKLGFAFTAFGSPYNSSNPETAKVLATDPNMKVWLYGNVSDAHEADYQGLVMERGINLEYPVHNPDFEAFVEAYNKGDHEEPLVLQGHPKSWDDARWQAFVKIIEFLQEEGCTFTTPTEWANRHL